MSVASSRPGHGPQWSLLRPERFAGKPHVETVIGAWLDGRLEWNEAIVKLVAAI